ncbi:hypothetical protein PUN28_009621 [Cardiocondyla obscurior]|uniref:Uncharacterized protein n=1 Tax=Cardiocondyla obscurior TaxID=286306 RepID=A0AAW2FUR5_9HYME
MKYIVSISAPAPAPYKFAIKLHGAPYRRRNIYERIMRTSFSLDTRNGRVLCLKISEEKKSTNNPGLSREPRPRARRAFRRASNYRECRLRSLPSISGKVFPSFSVFAIRRRGRTDDRWFSGVISLYPSRELSNCYFSQTI